MPITVISWNTKNTGLRKIRNADGTSTKFGEYLGAMLAYTDCDVVGLMEMRPGGGDLITPILGYAQPVVQAKYNNAVWQGRMSSPQNDNTRRECSAYLWNNTTVAPTNAVTPGPFFTPNVIDNNALQSILAMGNVAAGSDDYNDILTWLANEGLAYSPRPPLIRLPAPGFTWLVANADNIPNTFTPPTPTHPPQGFDAGQYRLGWYRTLYGTDFLWFPTMADRGPFIGQFTQQGGTIVLTTALFHAPGPTDKGVLSSANVIGNCLRLQQATTALVMGDFNITEWQGTYEEAPKYGLNGDNWTSGGSIAVFSQLRGDPLNAAQALGWQKTSLTNHCPAPTATALDARAQPYDIFFFKGGVNPTYAVNDLVNSALLRPTALEQDMTRYAADLLAVVVATQQLTWEQWFAAKSITLTATQARAKKKAAVCRTAVAVIDAQIAQYTNNNQVAPPLLYTRLASATRKRDLADAAYEDYSNQLNAYGSLYSALKGNAVNWDSSMAWLLIWRAVSDHLPIMAVIP